MRGYDFFSPNCLFIESGVYDEVSFELKRNICNDNDKLVWNNNPLYIIPNQNLTITGYNFTTNGRKLNFHYEENKEQKREYMRKYNKLNKKTIYTYHEAWAKENGYRENDTLNSKNTTCFKDGPER